MGHQLNHSVKVRWIKDGPATDALGSQWVKTFNFEELPELVTVPSEIKASKVRSYIEGRYGFSVGEWWYSAAFMIDNAYSGDPV